MTRARSSNNCFDNSTSSPTSPHTPNPGTSINLSLLHDHLDRITRAAVDAVDARRAIAGAIDRDAALRRETTPIRVVAAGKAGCAMAQGVDGALGARVRAGVATRLDADTASSALDRPSSPWEVITASHPVPDEGSEAAGRRALALADAAAADGGALLVCLSGGASAMLAVPAAGVTLAEKQAATRVLLRSGLSIDVLNTVRSASSAIKGGRLGARARRSLTLAISDVPVADADAVATIGSGPTAGQHDRRARAEEALARAGVLEAVPSSIRQRLTSTAPDIWGVPEGDARLAQATVRIVLSRHDAMAAAADAARRLGYDVRVVDEAVTGPAHEAWLAVWPAPGEAARPRCVIASGETTVRVTGEGRGGRNQELAVAALEPLARLAPAALASIGTDGIDGPTDAAGAFVDSMMWQRLGAARERRRDDALARHDAYPLLEDLGGLVRTGPTGTNVGDLIVLLLQ